MNEKEKIQRGFELASNIAVSLYELTKLLEEDIPLKKFDFKRVLKIKQFTLGLTYLEKKRIK